MVLDQVVYSEHPKLEFFVFSLLLLEELKLSHLARKKKRTREFPLVLRENENCISSFFRSFHKVDTRCGSHHDILFFFQEFQNV